MVNPKQVSRPAAETIDKFVSVCQREVCFRPQFFYIENGGRRTHYKRHDRLLDVY